MLDEQGGNGSLPNVYLAVRGMPVINDAVREDAVRVGFEKVCTVVDNGDDCPGTDLSRVSG